MLKVSAVLVYLQMIETEEDSSKFEAIYREYRDLLLFLADRRLRNPQDAVGGGRTGAAASRPVGRYGKRADLDGFRAKSIPPFRFVSEDDLIRMAESVQITP